MNQYSIEVLEKINLFFDLTKISELNFAKNYNVNMELNEKIEQSDLIDLRLVLYFLKRNFKLIGIYSISLLILSLIFAFTTKKV